MVRAITHLTWLRFNRYSLEMRLLWYPVEFLTISAKKTFATYRQPTRQGDDRFLHPAVPGNLHRPGLEPGPFRRTHQHGLGRFVEHHAHHLVATPRRIDPATKTSEAGASLLLEARFHFFAPSGPKCLR